jgi:hypothetical protein
MEGKKVREKRMGVCKLARLRMRWIAQFLLAEAKILNSMMSCMGWRGDVDGVL